ncbi:hypothetical protein ABFR46_15405 [Clostridioides difficile]
MILGVVAIILATGIFFLVNSIFDITYFGCGAIGGLWFGCFVIAYAILTSLGGILIGLIKWIVIGAIVLGIIGVIAGAVNKSE